ncbi:DUF2489 domain-containing protein [Pseudoalteromonas sp. T1lg75]|uniref:DUF2489 domain-containing protein n=1 Tax=Pseudoalteromonas sp. T1lg75 TaxID=2077102 RepID=UPI000CF60C0D|nr:DUF2489 domain-containing protein [Pseudoalteromonas sp. T1lg75]
MTSPWIIALIIGALIVAGLAFYAGRLLWQVREQNQRLAKQQAEYAQKRAARNAKLSDSINLIAKAMKEGQCEYSEGCLRVWVLMSQHSCAQELNLEVEYPGVFAMYEAVKDLPTHDARKKYSKKEIFKQDSARWRKEQELEEQILADSEKLVMHFDADPNSKHVFM